MERTIFFIVADEKIYPAERDYMKFIAAEICASGDENTSYCCLKIDQPIEHGIPKSCHHGPPVDNETYARIARYDDVYMEQAYGDVILTGVGASTQETLLKAHSALSKNSNARILDVNLFAPEQSLVLDLSRAYDLANVSDKPKLEKGLHLSI